MKGQEEEIEGKAGFTHVDSQLAVDAESGMLERLRDGHVGVLEVGVLAYERDAHGIEQALLTVLEKGGYYVCDTPAASRTLLLKLSIVFPAGHPFLCVPPIAFPPPRPR